MQHLLLSILMKVKTFRDKDYSVVYVLSTKQNGGTFPSLDIRHGFNESFLTKGIIISDYFHDGKEREL